MIIKIKNLRLRTILGIYKSEETIKREIIINVIIETYSDKALSTDDIDDTVDYDEIVAKIKKSVADNRVKLVEKIVGNIINLIMEDQRIKKCQLEIDKIGAVPDVSSVSITEIRERK